MELKSVSVWRPRLCVLLLVAGVAALLLPVAIQRGVWLCAVGAALLISGSVLRSVLVRCPCCGRTNQIRWRRGLTRCPFCHESYELK